jgi:hypothetical protein
MPEIRKFLDLSTAHLTMASRDMLDELGRYSAEGSPSSYLVGSTGFGWFVSANPADNEREDEEDIPDDLWAAMKHAKANGCDHILFDADAPRDPDLPAFED